MIQMSDLSLYLITGSIILTLLFVLIAYTLALVLRPREPKRNNDYTEPYTETYNQPFVSQEVDRVLDIYERSNVRIPKDIIEELSYMNFTSETEIFNYIENQRNYWKLENTKKPYKKPNR